MKVIVCLENNNGITFNNRRLTKDKKIIEDIVSLVGDKEIICSSYSAELFLNYKVNLNIDDNSYLPNGTNYYFLENIYPKYNNFSQLIVYKWNRDYPYDRTFSFDYNKYKIKSIKDLNGFSHKKITRIIYERKDS